MGISLGEACGSHQPAYFSQDVSVGHCPLLANVIPLPEEAGRIATTAGNPSVQAVERKVGPAAAEPLHADGAGLDVEV